MSCGKCVQKNAVAKPVVKKKPTPKKKPVKKKKAPAKKTKK